MLIYLLHTRVVIYGYIGVECCFIYYMGTAKT